MDLLSVRSLLLALILVDLALSPLPPFIIARIPDARRYLASVN